MAIDLGSRTTKAVCLQRKGDGYALASFVVKDAPAYEKQLSPQVLGEHLKSVMQALDVKARQVILVVGVNDALIRHAELPQVTITDMRAMLKINSKNYLQQELPDHVFDCQILPPRTTAPGAPEAAKPSPRHRVLVGAAKRSLVRDLQAATKQIGLACSEIVPGVVAPVNAFEAAQPEAFAKDVVALVDIGFKSSSINILLDGELILSRVVEIGGERLTTGLAEAMNISVAEAEGIKVGMPQEVQQTIQPLLAPLGRELRASIDFFEHQHDKAVSQVYVSGGAARSEFFLENLQGELMVGCKNWNPVSFLEMALPVQQMAELESNLSQLAVATGAAASVI
ncbi:MAG: pilus assembly protein PilM [Verrucomicrobia bacterium]|nr:pilus assembly protein PilM [Verrucomicrobiota bacterium]